METTLSTQKEEVEIDLREILFLLLDRVIVILLVGALAAGLAFLGTKIFITPTYQSETSIYVMNKNEEATVSSSDYVTSNYITQDYAVLITSRSVMEQVIADLDLGDSLTASQLAGMVSVENQDNTRIINITITDTNPVRAMDLANAVRIASSTKITEVMGIEDVNVVEEANLNATPVSPNVFKNMVIGAMLGMVITIAIIIIRHITDDTIQSPDEIEKYLGISTLASIPVMSEEEWDGDKKGSKKTKKSSRTGSSSNRTRTAASSNRR